MPLGILEDYKLEHVPGTAPLNEAGREDLNISGIDPGILKHDGDIVLVPQPSESPNDPYNWPRAKKERFTLAFIWGCACVGAVGPLMGAAFVSLAADFGTDLTTFVSGVQGGLIACIAGGSLLFNCLAVKYGKRPIYLATTVGLFVTCFWAAEAKSFKSLVASRVVQGLCMAPMEALIPASISDIWFVHQRGFRTALFNLGILGGINLATPIGGAIVQYGSYRILMHSMGGAFVFQLILVFFWMPETAYVRHDALDIDTGSNTISALKPKEITHVEHVEDKGATTAPVSDSAAEAPHTFWEEMLPYSGYVNHISFWDTLARPFWLLASPMVIWAIMLFTFGISWLVGISVTLSQIFSAPPYNFSVSSVGATNLSSFVATVIATLVAGPLIDGVAKRMSRKNNGIFEPEFRLPITSTYLIFTAVGFFAWGQSASARDPWPVPVVLCLGLINLGVQLGTTGVVTYVVDCHREKAGEAFAVMNFIKNLFAFGLTFYINDWIVNDGVRTVFFAMGAMIAGVTFLSIPMYIFGKRARSFVYRHNIAGRK